MSRSESNSVPTEQESDDAQPTTDDQLDHVARPDPEWVDDQFRATGRYDY